MALKTTLMLMVAVCACSWLPAQAEEGPTLDWVTTVGVGVKELEFEETRAGVIRSRIDNTGIGSTFSNRQTFKDSIYYADLGLGVSFNRFYVTANYEVPFSDVSANKKFIGTVTQFTSETDVDRVDWAITGGYSVNEYLSVFGGWKYGETEQSGISDELVENGPPPGLKLTYEGSGPFVGASVGYPLWEGQLSFSIAYADLDTDYESRAAFGTPATATSTNTPMLGPEEYSGDAKGFSYGVKYTGILTESAQYYASIKYQNYDLDGNGVRQNLTNPNVTGDPAIVFETIDLDIETEEIILAFTAGVQFIF